LLTSSSELEETAIDSFQAGHAIAPRGAINTTASTKSAIRRRMNMSDILSAP
jgi:hypothetical protein